MRGDRPATGDNARAALVAMIAATGASEAGRRLCATLLDAAEAAVLAAPPEVIIACGGSADAVDRMAGAALLCEVCASCRLCPRGAAMGDGVGPLGIFKRRAG